MSDEKISHGNVAGFEVDFVEPVSADWICSVCHELIHDVHETVCGHLFCVACITNWMANHTTCPVCRTDNYSENVNPARYVDRLVQNVKVKCPNECGQEIPAKGLKDHANKDCDNRSWKCSVCEQKMKRKDMEEHLRTEEGHFEALMKSLEGLRTANEGLILEVETLKASSAFTTADVLIDGREGTNSFMNGIWRFAGTHSNFPYYTKDTDFLYCMDHRWRISRKLGEASKINAYFDSRPGNPVWVVYDGESFGEDREVTSSFFFGFDLRITGRAGYNSIINGLWTQKGAHDRPFYKKDDLFLYSDGKRWRISKNLGSTDRVLAFLDIDSKSPGTYRTPDRTTGWKIWCGDHFSISDKSICIERSYGCNLVIKPREGANKNRITGVWIQKGSHGNHPYYTMDEENETLYLFSSGSIWYIALKLGDTTKIVAQAESRGGTPEGVSNWQISGPNGAQVNADGFVCRRNIGSEPKLDAVSARNGDGKEPEMANQQSSSASS